MCYKYARLINEGLSLPSRGDYFRPPFTGMDVVLVPELPVRAVNNMVMAAPSLVAEFTKGLDLSAPLESVPPLTHPEPLFVVNGVATYVTAQGRAYRLPASSPPLPSRGHGSGGSSPSQQPTPQVGRGRARLAALVRSWRNPGHSRD